METNRVPDAVVGSGEKLEVRLAVFGGRPWLFLVPFAVLVVAVGLAGRSPSGFWSSIALAVFIVGLFAFQIIRNLRKNGAGPVMILDLAGVTVGSDPLVRWSDVDRISVGPLAAGFLPASLMWGSVVAFVPKPGVAMPPPPGGRRVSAETQAAWQQARLQRYGTNLTVVTTLMSVSTDELVDAAERLGQVTVTRRRPKRGEAWPFRSGRSRGVADHGRCRSWR